MAPDEPLIIDSGPVTLAATFEHDDEDQEVTEDGSDRPGTGQ